MKIRHIQNNWRKCLRNQNSYEGSRHLARKPCSPKNVHKRWRVMSCLIQNLGWARETRGCAWAENQMEMKS